MAVQPLTSRDPDRIGGYELKGRLGAGGQGVVYLGETAEGRRVAVKLLHDRARVDAFRKEVAAARRVSAFCTARVLDDGEDEGTPFVVSEYIDGPSLREVVEGGGTLAGTALYRLAVGSATALAAIHQAGIVHRDFKPGNVLLGPDGPRVIDFGIARALDATVTATSTVLGTPSYMAPEQLAGDVVGPPADVFAWGATIAYAANGRPPYGQDTIPAVMHRIMTGRPDLGALDGPLRDLITRCLARDPAERPDSREILLRLLDHTEGPIAAVEALEQGRTLATADDTALADARTARWTTLRLDRPPAPSGRSRRSLLITITAAAAALLFTTATALALTQDQTGERGRTFFWAQPDEQISRTEESRSALGPGRASTPQARSEPRTPAGIAATIERAMSARGTAAFSAEGLLSQSLDAFKATGRFEYKPGAATDYDMTVHNPNGDLYGAEPMRVLLVGDLGYLPGRGEGIPLAPADAPQDDVHLDLAVEARLVSSPYNVVALMENAANLKRTSDAGTHTYQADASPIRLASSGPVAPFYRFFADSRVEMAFTLTVTHDHLPMRLDIEVRAPVGQGDVIGASYWATYRDWGRSGTIVKPY
ncbi:serine/threonine-protein kinase [Thermomonospora cellulosilytica]|uniref:Serine/threonine protein kinase n=1 Tax=Thermomonospora cellulosilytica TaxID=1411118 RepID=A0A7W3MZL8_9ACTN|nr:serine/threonine-protein kinase [Thermomonospora cellulosilytica]MBA9004809.1 serine/threonine protein kinase [Thermomonospora cellulosilytica]